MSSAVSPLPTGTVTFLLTDIEGSTQAWQAAPDSMTALVSRHYEILEAGIAAHRGQRPEEQGEGDSVVAVFVNPCDAVAAALETQLTLRRELPDLPVRMSLHTGEAMLRNENNYVGLTIIRCARIRSCGYGGQILVSDDTVAHVGGTLPSGAGVLDLGVYGLRGLDGRDRVWQLTHPDLPVAFPPLKAGTSAAGNLPATISSFVGRRTELAAISDSIAGHRLITIAGEAGVGKSRLAHAAASAAANSMPGGIWWVALAELADDDLESVTAAVSRACSLRRPAPDDPFEALAEHFNSIADALLVLDGSDQAPTAAAQLVDQVLTRCPDLRLLTTGRQPLRIPGETVHELAPMAVPPEGFEGDLAELERFDAARLFIERAASAHPGNEFSGRHVSDIARICRELGGLPLGIELAAARSGSASIAELAVSLSSLAGSAEAEVFDALASSIAWSYQALGDAGQAALRRLAVFRGGFEIDAAAAVVIGAELDEQAAMAAIRGLLDQQLLGIDDASGRLTLAPSIREFAHRRLLASPDLAGATDRHGAWFAELAEQFGAAGPANPASLLVPDKADVLGALETSMHSDDVSVAYRILIGLGAWWHLLDQADAVDAAADWVCGRSPSDGEERWAAAVSRLSFALAAKPDAAIHEFADEARAIAELTGDQISPCYVEFGPAARTALRGDLTPAESLSAAARDRGVAEVAIAIEQLAAAVHAANGRTDQSESVRQAAVSLLGGGIYEGPLDVSGVDADGPSTVGTVLDDMAPRT